VAAYRASFLLLTFGALAGVQAATPSRDAEMVCVPAADGRSWDCGTRANPPADRALPSTARVGTSSAPPPPFLAAPGRRGMPTPAAPPPPVHEPYPAPAADADAVVVTPLDETPAAPVEALPENSTSAPAAEIAVSNEPAAAADAEPETSAETALETAPGPAPDVDPGATAVTRTSDVPSAPPPPMLAAPRQRLAPYPPADMAPTEPVASNDATPDAPSTAPASTAQPIVAAPAVERADADETSRADPVVAQPAGTEPPAAAPPPPARAAAPPVPDEPSRSIAIDLRGRGEFLALPANRFTLQLARVAAPASAATRLPALLAFAERTLRPMGIDGIDFRLYVVRVEAAGRRDALLLWSDFPDAESARAAWDLLPAPPGGKPAAYPRRLAPLQDEVRRLPP
jgi:hypothetical protein